MLYLSTGTSSNFSNVTMLSATSLLHNSMIFNRNNTVATTQGMKTYWLWWNDSFIRKQTHKKTFSSLFSLFFLLPETWLIAADRIDIRLAAPAVLQLKDESWVRRGHTIIRRTLKMPPAPKRKCQAINIPTFSRHLRNQCQIKFQTCHRQRWQRRW